MNNKKTIMILILILFVGIVGLILAYFANSTSVDNIFTSQPYGTTVEETFTSPSNWLPGDETTKTVVATNSGNVDQAVRIKITEKWLDSNNNELNGWIHEDGTKSNYESNEDIANDERVAIINFDNNSDWTYNNGYYYYNYKLSPNESTSSLIKSVTFNPKTKLDDTCTSSVSNGKKTVTCISSGTNYDNATYTLTFTIETVQFNKYSDAWGVDVALAENRQLFCDYFEVGEVVDYKGSEYYVLKDSSTEDDYVTLIKSDPLTYDELVIYNNGYEIERDSVDNNIGTISYYKSDTCYYNNDNDKNTTGCNIEYDNSFVKPILDNWSNTFSNDLKEIDGYKTRLITFDELINLGYYERYYYGTSYYHLVTDSDTLCSSIYDFWYNTGCVGNICANFSKSSVRPVINLKKCAIDNTCE